ncbi:hypothetical protein ACVGVM_24295 [Pseudonocardia bannensis]|uniref:Uncharacterized protein n=1 Tax=Pseudonocardia bannensis TaxID=630973 RepID=A0A848DFY4_9PSEU|nr:hypothetical protein [Pseudonocardia bannensis]NMH91562.1 hypothetical protein [Pseudonocardia bannensis]
MDVITGIALVAGTWIAASVFAAVLVGRILGRSPARRQPAYHELPGAERTVELPRPRAVPQAEQLQQRNA